MRRLNQLPNFSRNIRLTRIKLKFVAFIIDLDVAFYMHLTWQFDSPHVKCDL